MKDDSFEYRRIVSEKQTFEPLWVEFYKEFAHINGSQLTYMEFNVSIDPNPYLKNYPFPLSQIEIHQDDNTQKRGFDKRISFQDGKSFIIEEKVRYQDYGDVFVERWEDKRIRKVGWAWDTELISDYVAYAIWPAKLCIFMNLKQLQTLLIENEHVYMRRRQFKNDQGGYLSTGPTLSFEEIQTQIPDSFFIQK